MSIHNLLTNSIYKVNQHHYIHPELRIAATYDLRGQVEDFHHCLDTSCGRNNGILALGLADLVLISSKVACLGRSGIATNDCRVAIEILGDLLERRVLGLDEPLPNDKRLKGDPANVDQVVLPGNGLQGDGVDVLIEPEGDVDKEEHDSETLMRLWSASTYSRYRNYETG